MADYIYLLETRLSEAQRKAIDAVREVARSKGMTVFLVGGAVRDLTSGSPVRDLDLVVQGNALKLKKDFDKLGASLAGENDPGQTLYLAFPGGVRMELGSTLSVNYPKPGKPVFKTATLLDDLRRRDFTANAMALSLNEGSYGLLMDPLNGVADIENRELRLVSNYGFIEDPVRMIRAARLMARLGWQMEEKTRGRYETGKQEGYISAMSEFHRGYETEEIFHEEDPLRVMRRLEEEGWMQHLAPALTVAKANVVELERLRELQLKLQVQGVLADAAAANFPLLTAKLSAAEITQLKRTFPRQGFVAEIDALESRAKEFAGQLVAKAAMPPSQAFQLIHHARPEAVLWAAHTSKSVTLQAKLKSFQSDWPQARQRIPHLLMQEMRIVPELPAYDELLEKLFYELMDGRLSGVEEMKAFLESYSPPAPPPPVHLRRARSTKKDAKGAKGRKKLASVSLDDDEEAQADPDRDQGSESDDEEKQRADESKDASADRVDDDDDARTKGGEVNDAPVRKSAPAPMPTAVAIPARDTESVPPDKELTVKAAGNKATAKRGVSAPEAAVKPVRAKVAAAAPEQRSSALAATASKTARDVGTANKVVEVPARPAPVKADSARAVPAKKGADKATSTSPAPVKGAAAKAYTRAASAVIGGKKMASAVPASKKAVGSKSAPPVKSSARKTPVKITPAKKALKKAMPPKKMAKRR